MEGPEVSQLLPLSLTHTEEQSPLKFQLSSSYHSAARDSLPWAAFKIPCWGAPFLVILAGQAQGGYADWYLLQKLSPNLGVIVSGEGPLREKKRFPRVSRPKKALKK